MLDDVSVHVNGNTASDDMTILCVRYFGGKPVSYTHLTILGLAFLMNYSGMSTTLGIGFTKTGSLSRSSPRSSAGSACS